MMTKILWAFLICCVWAKQAQAQQYAPIIVRADLSMAVQNGAGAALEWQYSQRSAIAFQAFWQKHNSGTYLFNGDLLANFSEILIDTIIRANNKVYHNTETVYVGEGRPLPVLGENIGVSSLGLRLGHKFIFSKKTGKWNLSLQPSISLIQHHYFEVKQIFELLDQAKQVATFGPFQYQTKVVKTYGVYHEKQAMRERFRWLPGIAYDIGVGRRFGQRWSAEARVSGLYNLQTAYKAPQPAPVRAIQVRGHLFVGYMLGKMHSVPLPSE